jgi:hypothetical protein
VSTLLPSDLPVKITVHSTTTTDYPVPIYEVELGGEGVWIECFGSLRELQAFLKGVQAGVRSLGKVFYPPLEFREDWIRARLHEAPYVLWPEERGDM